MDDPQGLSIVFQGVGVGGLYTVVETSAEQAAVSQQLWLREAVQNITKMQ